MEDWGSGGFCHAKAGNERLHSHVWGPLRFGKPLTKTTSKRKISVVLRLRLSLRKLGIY